MTYIPPEAQKLSDITIPQIRIALQGHSGTGKTYSGLTFPNVTVCDFDGNLVAYKHRTDVNRLAFCNDKWCRDTFPKIATDKIKYAARNCFKHWLEENIEKFEPDQTLFIDSWTSLQDAFDLQTHLEPVFTSRGQIDEYAFWDLKIEYSREILTLLKEGRCHVVVSFHEQDTRDSSGALSGKIEPLMQGKFQKKLGLYFTDWVRCCVESVMDTTDKKLITGNKFYWLTKSTSEVNLKTRLDLPMRVEPSFESFKNYFTAVTQQ